MALCRHEDNVVMQQILADSASAEIEFSAALAEAYRHGFKDGVGFVLAKNFLKTPLIKHLAETCRSPIVRREVNNVLKGRGEEEVA